MSQTPNILTKAGREVCSACGTAVGNIHVIDGYLCMSCYFKAKAQGKY